MTLMPKHRGTVAATAALVLFTTATTGASPGQRGQQESLTLLSVAAGPRGAEVSGQFRLDEVRSQFSRQRDTQVVVYFQWRGISGKHRFAARWRAPGGDLSTQSEFDFEARERQFGAYWVLPLSPSTPVGRWSIEATVDGLPSGRLSFEIVDDAVAASEPRRRPLEPARLFERARGVFAEVRRSSPLTAYGSTVAGMVVAPGTIATIFAAIDATDVLTVVLADGSTPAGLAVSGWDRRQGWALLASASPGPPALPPAAGPMKVGDKCYSIMGGAGGGYILVEGSIVGTRPAEAGGEAYIANFFSGVAFPGAPVLDEYGDVVGIVGGNALLGASSLVRQMATDRFGRGLATGPVIPVAWLSTTPGDGTVSIDELRRRGVLIPPVVGDHVVSGGFARQMTTKPTMRPIDEREEFAVGERGAVYAFVTWDPKVRLKGMVFLRLFDQENRLVLESKPKKTNMKPGDYVFTNWQMPLPARPGTYRADVLIDTEVTWRGYFRVTP